MSRNNKPERLLNLVESSPLRKADPRAKFLLCLWVSLAVMLPIKELVAVFVIFLLFLAWAQLFTPAILQLWKIKWILLFLFLGDWFLVSLELAVLITFRISLFALSFKMFFSTTTPAELSQVLVWLRLPYRYAFTIGLSFKSIGTLDNDWRSIIEAQKSRGIILAASSIKKIMNNIHNLVSLTVPAVVLTTRRAWAMTEAACARGFDSPKTQPYNKLKMSVMDWSVLIIALALSLSIKFLGRVL